MNRLKDKVAIITGGAKGMGEASAKAMVAEGAKVVITDLDEENGKKVASSLGDNCVFIKQDVSKEQDWKDVISYTVKHFGKLNVLFNNAGVAIFGDAETITDEAWQKTMDINVTGIMYGMREAISVMKNNDEHNSIINTSSIEGYIGIPNMFAYVASKGAVRLMTKAAALDIATKGYDIKVNSIHPGTIRTPMVENEIKNDPSLEKVFTSPIPMGRMGKPEEVANLAVYLASDESSYSTGSEFIVDGGYLAQ